MEVQEKKRIGWIDIAKAFAIFLVVIGHVFRGGDTQRIIYSFHVAAFFALSGMTCHVRDIKVHIKNDLLRIMVPYYIFGLISILVFVVLGQFAAGALQLEAETSLWANLWDLLRACPKGNRMKFNMPLWFLPCLFVTKLMYYALHKCCRGKHLWIVGGSSVLAALGFVYTRIIGISLPFNLTVAVKMLLFFSLGRVAFQWISKRETTTLPRFLRLMMGVVCLALIAVIAWYSPKINYSGDTFPHILSFMATALLGSAGLCLLAMGIGACRPLEYVGKNTLPILLMHKFPILFFQTIGPLTGVLEDYTSPLNIIAAIGVSLLSIALCLFAAWIIKRWMPFLLGDFSRFARHGRAS